MPKRQHKVTPLARGVRISAGCHEGGVRIEGVNSSELVAYPLLVYSQLQIRRAGWIKAIT